MGKADTHRSRTREPGQKAWHPYLYLAPGLVIYALFVLYPIVQTVIYSLFSWRGYGTAEFVGLQNFVNLLQDPLFLLAFKNNLLFIVFYTAFPIIIGLVLTGLIANPRVRGLIFFRTALFLPQVMSMVVIGVVWRWIYNPAFGPLNELLTAVGLSAWARSWLGDFDLALPAVGVVATWIQYGFCMVLFMAGVQRIDASLYDAAKLDGANARQQFMNVTLPGIQSEISVAVVTTLISAFRTFDLVFVMTDGGPANRTLVSSLYLYRNAFEIGQVGYASAIATVLTVVILLASYFVLTWRSRISESY